MRIIRLFIVIYMLGLSSLVFGSQTHSYIFIRFLNPDKALSSEQETLNAFVEDELTGKIMNEFPCADVLSVSSLRYIMTYTREAALLGNDEMGEKGMDALRRVMNADYLVYIDLNTIGSTYYLMLRLEEPQRARMLINQTKSGSSPEQLEQLIDDFVNEMAYYEICPYLGNFTVKVHSTLEKEDQMSFEVYCNEKEQTQVVSTKTIAEITTDWSLEKNGYRQGKGEMSYTSFEEIITVNEAPCYRCSSGRMAGRTSHLTKTSTAKGDKVSTESSFSNQPLYDGQEEVFDDVRVKIKFNKDDTYLIMVNASSANIPTTITEVEEISGSCDTGGKNESHTKFKTTSVDHIFGPFKGTPQQKNLKESGEFSEDVNGTKKEYQFSFNLTRE